MRKVDLKGVPAETDFNCISQDNEGFIWLGALNGLYRYDGLRTNRFLRDPSDTNSLSHNYVNALAKDKEGNIWIGTFGGFMNKFERTSGTIKRIEQHVVNVARTVVLRSRIAGNGDILAATAQGIYRINIAGNVVDSFMIPSSQTVNIRVSDFLEVEEGKFLLTTASGLYSLHWKQKQLQLVTSLPSGKKFNCIEPDGHGRFWIGTDSGIVICNPDMSLSDKPILNNPSLINRSSISTLKTDRDGRMWIGADAGLFYFNKGNFVQVLSRSVDSLRNINELLLDNKGTVWVCTEGMGLFQVYKLGIIFQTIPGMQAFSKDLLIQSLLEESPDVWRIGTRFGLYRYSFSTKKFEEIILGRGKNSPWIAAQLKDRNGGEWVGTFGQGVFFRAAGTADFIHITTQFKGEEAMPLNTVVAFEEDLNGNIWMGTFSSGSKMQSLCYFDPATGKVYTIHATDNANSFKSVDISQIESDSEHHLWIGTWDMGVYEYYGKAGKPQLNSFRNFSEASPAPKKASHNIASCVRPARNGRVWFGTMSGGLNMIDTKTDSTAWFTVKDGLPSNLIYRIEEDDQGILWLSTDNGIARFDPATKSIMNYSVTHGLPANDYAFLTSMKTSNGTIAFGTGDGQVVFFNPNSFNSSSNSLAVVITDIRLFNKSLETGRSSPLTKTAYLTDTLRLNYDQSVISFDLSNMEFLDPEVRTYAYKLDGFDKDWTYISDRHSITYTNLDPGAYTLLIKNANHLGIWNDNPKKLTLFIKAPFWLTWWFMALVFLLVMAVIYSVFRYRLQQKMKIFSVRNRLHRDLHDDVGATLSSVKAYSEILNNNPQNVLMAELIRDNASEMLERLEVIAWATNPQHDNFESLKSRMTKFAAPLCHARSVKFHLRSHNIADTMEISGEIRQNIFLVFKEAINNMIKYSEATECDTNIDLRNSQFVLQISDNGKGFDGKINGSGHGWKNMHKRSEELSGKLFIDSMEGRGTKVTMTLAYPFKIPNSWDRNRG